MMEILGALLFLTMILIVAGLGAVVIYALYKMVKEGL